MKVSKKKINKKSTNKKFYKTNPSGISLIVLVITIIVVIILAAAVIISLQNNNPMVEAREAKIKSDVANMQAIFTNTVGKIMAENQDTIKVDPKQLNTVTSGVNKATGEATYKIMGEDGNPVVEGIIKFSAGTNEGTTYYTGKELPIYTSETKWYVDENGMITVNVGGVPYGEGEQTETDPPVIPTPSPSPEEPEEPVEPEEPEDVKAEEFIDENGQKAIIPIGFSIVPGKNIVKDGLVISDVENDTADVGNQYVWVPVDNMKTFVREEGYNNSELQNMLSSCSEPLDYGDIKASESEIEEYNNMMESIKEYHGFYIGRYELSYKSGKLESKKGKSPYTDVRWGKSMTDLSEGIIKEIRDMYPEEKSKKGSTVSTLVYGVCWDETVRFIKKNYPNIDKDSSGYGYHNDKYGSTRTGRKEEYALNNIYDMTGNIFEWTMEAYEDNQRVARGGYYGSNGIDQTISSRYTHAPYWLKNSFWNAIGARAQLYIK